MVAQIHVMKMRNPCNKFSHCVQRQALDSDQIHVNGGGIVDQIRCQRSDRQKYAISQRLLSRLSHLVSFSNFTLTMSDIGMMSLAIWRCHDTLNPIDWSYCFTDMTWSSEENLRSQNLSNQGSKATKDHNHCSVTHQVTHDLWTNHGPTKKDSQNPHHAIDPSPGRNRK